MSTLCDVAMAFGLTLSGICPQPATTPEPMPPDDPGAWSYVEPRPEPAPSAPAPQFPPVVIEKKVYLTQPAPAPRPAPAPAPTPKVEAVRPDPMAQAIRAAYLNRTAHLDAWPEIKVPVSVLQQGGSEELESKAVSSAPKMRPSPLDLATAVRQNGDERYQADGVTSTLPVDNTRILASDRYISGVVETGLNSQLDGTTGASLVIQTSRNVFGYHGRKVLLPKGSRLVCEYKSPDKMGNTRVTIRCGRILLGETRAEIYSLKANVTDQQGRLGVSGDVDTRFYERFGTAFILAGISAAVRGAAAASSQLESLADNSDSITTSAEELSQNLGDVAASALEQTINLNPIITIAQGTRVQIRPSQDWYIKKVE